MTGSRSRNGLEALALARQRCPQTPFLLVSGTIGEQAAIESLKAGATDFLTKPVDAAALVQAVRAALQMAETRHQTIAETAALAARLATLTPREREIMEHVVTGQLNKQIASDLGTGEQNIKLHRAHIMRKMGVESLADLVRAAERLGVGTGQ